MTRILTPPSCPRCAGYIQQRVDDTGRTVVLNAYAAPMGTAGVFVVRADLTVTRPEDGRHTRGYRRHEETCVDPEAKTP